MEIKKLELYTQNLAPQIQFYSETLGLKIIKKTAAMASFQIGKSILTLTETSKSTPYHYAINIPSNQEQEALKWLKERVTILKDGDKEIQYFDFWNAHAIYFYDSDHNIVELIARKNIGNDSTVKFTELSLLEISEMGIPTADIARDYDIIHQATGLGIHSGSTERFCAIGDDHGLFIMINKKLKKEWYPTKDKPHSSDFKIRFIANQKPHYLKYANEKFIELFAG